MSSVKCLECGEDVALTTFRQHQAQCNVRTQESETLAATENSVGLVGMSSDGGKLNEEYDILNTISQSDRRLR